VFLKSISLIFLLFFGCANRTKELYIPTVVAPKKGGVELVVVNRLNPPWVIGEIDKEELKVSSDLALYIKRAFLKSLKHHTKSKVVVDIRKFIIKDYKNIVYAYVDIKVTYRFKDAFFEKKIEIKRAGIKDIQKSLIKILDEIVSIMEQSYEMYFMQKF
jgi:hypothetical protein